MRGLKPWRETLARWEEEVAPYVGAWIETRKTEPLYQNARVAPYVGAWIETYSRKFNQYLVRSHPTWVRGLKLGDISYYDVLS